MDGRLRHNTSRFGFAKYDRRPKRIKIWNAFGAYVEFEVYVEKPTPKFIW